MNIINIDNFKNYFYHKFNYNLINLIIFLKYNNISNEYILNKLNILSYSNNLKNNIISFDSYNNNITNDFIFVSDKIYPIKNIIYNNNYVYYKKKITLKMFILLINNNITSINIYNLNYNYINYNSNDLINDFKRICIFFNKEFNYIVSKFIIKKYKIINSKLLNNKNNNKYYIQLNKIIHLELYNALTSYFKIKNLNIVDLVNLLKKKYKLFKLEVEIFFN
tara:strand:+ start:30 stop:695 length:666 start_codon:yes stop_codon:yes gene_type:complete